MSHPKKFPEMFVSPLRRVMVATLLMALWPAPMAYGATASRPTVNLVPQGAGKISKSRGLPKVITIPRLGIRSAIELTGINPRGIMESPKSPNNVGWYHFGTRPGERGNAVISGHLNSYGGLGVFQNLWALRPGDLVAVTNDRGQTKKFRVRQTRVFPLRNVPMNQIIGSAPTARLNLVTCSGNWSSRTRNYSHRLIVYTEAV